MSQRWFRTADEEAAFDWQRQARDLEVPIELARALYVRAMQRAVTAGPRGVEDLYRRWLHDAAAARGLALVAPPVPGRQTRVMHEAGNRARRPAISLDPGRWTRAMFETDHDDRESRLPGLDDVQRAIGALTPGADAPPDAAPASPTLRDQLLAAAERGRGAAAILATADPVAAAAALRELRITPVRGQPALRLVARADDGAAARLLGRGSTGTRLPDDLAARLRPHVGSDATAAARLHTDDTADLVAAAHHAHAVTLGDRIYFARGAFAPGTEHGDDLLAHELTHVAQGQRGALARAAAKGLESGGALDPAEAEAELRAKLAVIQLHAPAAAAPSLAAPAGQPTSAGARAAQIAAQQARLALANQPAGAQEPVAAPPPSSPQAAVAHPAPPMAAPHAPGHTGNAYVDTFSAPPSKQATELWSTAGTQATGQAAVDQARFDGSLQPMPIVLDGTDHKSAKGGGTAHAPKGAPTPGSVPPAAQPTPTPTPPPVTLGAALAQAVKPIADKAQLKADASKAIDALPTTSPDIKTDPGPAPVTDLAGQADPVRAVGDQQHAAGEGAKALDAEKTKVLAGPGAAQIQPAKLDDKLAVPKEQAAGAMPALPTVEGMAKLKKWNLPADTQASFDQIAKPKMDATLAQAKAKMTEADARRDVDRSKAVADSQDKVKQAHVDADKQQQTKVAATRTEIANHQADTLLKQETEVKKLDQQSGDKKTAALAKVNTRIQADQAKVDADYQNAQKQADDKKRQGDEDAAKKKKEAEDKKKDEHWWDKAADAVCDGIKAIADEIDKALDAVCKAIGSLLDAVKDAACKLIDAARDFVCAALSEFGDWLKSAVTALIGSVFPELAAQLNRLIDAAVNAAKAAVNAIADGLKKAVSFVCNALKGAIDGIIAAFKAAVQAAATFAQAMITGDWSLVGKMILDGILRAIGVDPAAFYALISSAEDSIEKIIANPGAFVGNLINAVKQGFHQFSDHFWDHLKDGVVQWLFGTMAGAGIHMVGKFDVAGVFSLVGQILGITPQAMHIRVAKKVGEQNADRLDFVSTYIQGFMASGRLEGLWEKIHDDMSGLWDVVIGGVKQFLIESVVKQAIIKIATMWNPAGAIVQLIETAWNVYQWVKTNSYRIFGLVKAVVDSVANIVSGNIGSAATQIESALARLIPVAISLFADLLGLTGIAEKIQGIVQKVGTMVNNAIDKLIAKVMSLFKGKGKGGKDDKHDKDGHDDKDAPEVPRALAESHKVKLSTISAAAQQEAAHTASGTVLYSGGTSEPKAATKAILSHHPDARMDKAGVLHLPPTQANASPSSLKALAADVGHSTGLPRITFVTTPKGWRLDGQINPIIEALVDYTGGPGGRLEPLVHALAADAAKPQYAKRAVLEALLRQRATEFHASVVFGEVSETGAQQVTFKEQTAPASGTAEQVHAVIEPIPTSDMKIYKTAGKGNTTKVDIQDRSGTQKQVALANVGPEPTKAESAGSMAANPKFEADARAFEDKFGVFATSTSPVARQASAAMAAKAQAYITAKLGRWDATDKRLQAMFAKIGSDDPTWSGSVGKAVKPVMDAFEQGTIAEQLSHVGSFFTQILGEDLFAPKADEVTRWMTKADFDVEQMLQRRDEMLAAANVYAIQPIDPESAATDQWKARADRATAANSDRATVGTSIRTLEQSGADMSAREKALAKWKAGSLLPWIEGTRVWVMNERDSWVQWHRKLSLPLGAGPSGTTNQLMRAASALKVEAYGARAACIAYMLPAHHHTLVEILSAAATFGCSFTDNQQMYHHIQPYSEPELRTCGRPDKDGKMLFPDEPDGNGDTIAADAPVMLRAPSSGGGASH